ncbi:protein NEGATIVE REGULATOR OF RESISTANCE-like [Phragmites australis]|uniref:protein NEGATIVE REGULATOR OF RESISTANCE-like n=1 Tax=Phragmites australis TaxID=29695 RepID=UPI002D7718E6|nr:protein NEGATIVE REGULATOR OF RESISTANCE-like [Phragmites australis]
MEKFERERKIFLSILAFFFPPFFPFPLLINHYLLFLQNTSLQPTNTSARCSSRKHSSRCETMDATTTKRKRPAADIPSDATAAAAVDEVSDAEVEEFYAILRRMRDASRRLCGAGARPPPRAPAWRPSFSWEDFAPAPAPEPAQPRPDERVVAENAAAPRAGLDLNAEPEPDTLSEPATPRSARTAPA